MQITNKEAVEVLKDIIEKHLGFQGKSEDKWWLQSSTKYYIETGKPSGSFFNAVKSIAEEYAAIEALEKESWVSVEERLPEEHEKVLVMYGDQNILIGIMDSRNQWAVYWKDGLQEEDFDRPITHWMPLPTAPVK